MGTLAEVEYSLQQVCYYNGIRKNENLFSLLRIIFISLRDHGLSGKPF
jgi:hypothetical protein